MKQAVVYILDASSSMQGEILADGGVPWDLAREHVTAHYGTTMLHSAASLACIIICRTATSTNHRCVVEDDEEQDDDDLNNPFLHLTEVDSYGLRKCNVSVLKVLRDTTVNHDDSKINDTSTNDDNAGRGTVLDAFRLALDALEGSTAGKKFERAVYVYTDAAGHNYEMNLASLQDMLQGLKALECPVHVMSFQSLSSMTDCDNKIIKDEAINAAKVKVEPIKMEDSAAQAQLSPIKSAGKSAPDTPKSNLRYSSTTDVKIKQETPEQPPSAAGNDDSSVTDVDEDIPSSPRSKKIKQEDGDTVKPEAMKTKTRRVIKKEYDDDNDEHDNDKNGSDDEQEDEDEEDVVLLDSRTARDEFLKSLTQQTGGTYRAIHLTSDVPAVGLTQKDVHLTKTTLLLTPSNGADISHHPYAVPLRLGLLHAKQGAPTLKHGVLVFEKNNDENEAEAATASMTKPQSSSTNPIQYDDTVKITKYVNLADPDSVPVDAQLTAQAIRYGSEWKVVDAAFEHATIPKDLPGPAIQILAYTSMDTLDGTQCQGPCHIVSGHDSERACAAVTALSRALYSTNKAALVLVAKTRTVKATKLGALLPAGPQRGDRLYMITLPYAGEVKQMASDDWLEAHPTSDEELQAATDLIDALWLSDEQAMNVLEQSEPFQEAWKETLLNRAVNPQSADLVIPRRKQDQDALATPVEIKENAQSAIELFRKTFPLVLKPSTEKEKKRQGQKALTYTNFLEDDA